MINNIINILNKFFIFFAFCFFVIISCNEKSSKKIINNNYEKNNLSFTLPPDWKVAKDEIINNARFIEVNQYSNYGTIINTIGITIYDDLQKPENLLKQQIEEIKNAYSKVNFSLIKENIQEKIGVYNVISTSYKGDDNQTLVYGKISVFKTENKIVSIQIVGKNSDTFVDYNSIINTLSIK